MFYLLSVISIALYLAFVKSLDGSALVHWGRIAECMGWGVFVCISSFFLGRVIDFSDGSWAPAVEEFIKSTPLLIAILRNRSAFFVEALMYGAAIGAGFALPENFLYVYFNPDFTLGDAIVRAFGTALLHIGCTALAASAGIMMTRFSLGWSLPARVGLQVLSIVPSFLIHSVYNMFLLPEFIQMIIVVILMLSLILTIYEIDQRLVHKWLDMCINNDIALYKSMKKGELQKTRAGEYLMLARERFNPEIFFDICVYLGLYLELTIAAKSRMILKEAGMDGPVSEAEHSANLAKLKELDALRSAIGTSGLLLLSPIVGTKAADDWVINELL